MSAPAPVLSIEERFNLAAKEKNNLDDPAGSDFAKRVEIIYHLGGPAYAHLVITKLRNVIVEEAGGIRDVPFSAMAERNIDRIENWMGLLGRLVTDAENGKGNAYLAGRDQYEALALGFLVNADEILGDIAAKKITPPMTDDMRDAATRLLQMGVAAKKTARKYNDPKPVFPPNRAG